MTDRNVDALQWKIIKEHLALVLSKTTSTVYESPKPLNLDKLFVKPSEEQPIYHTQDVDQKLKEAFSNFGFNRGVLDLIAKEPIPNYLEKHGIEKLGEIRC